MVARAENNCLQIAANKEDKRSAQFVEYNMDEIDKEILDVLSEKHTWITEDTYELVMDRLEKEHHFLQRIAVTKVKDNEEQPSECNICGDQETSNENFLVFCDGCNLAVHQACYGIPNIPDGSWLCRPCLLQPNRKIGCFLCTLEGGALKKTGSGHWCHVLCALLVPSARFENLSFLEPVDISEVRRNSRVCSACGSKRGGVVPCAYLGCEHQYHATCAGEEDLYIDLGNYLMYCEAHDPRRRTEGAGASWMQPDLNYPALSATPVIRKNVGIWTPQKTVISSISAIEPKILHYTVNRIVCRDLNGRKGSTELVRDMCAVWAVRRRKKTINKKLRLDIPSTELAGWGEYVPNIEVDVEEEDSDIQDNFTTSKWEGALCTLFRYTANRLVKIAKLIRGIGSREKRSITEIEKKRKKVAAESVEGYEEMVMVLEEMIAQDAHGIFLEHVTEDIAPDYLTVISEPRCLSEIERMVKNMECVEKSEVFRYVDKMIENAYVYNGKGSFVVKEAQKLEKIAKRWRAKAGDTVVSEVGPYPPMPYRVIKNTATTPKGCLRLESLISKEKFEVKRSEIEPTGKNKKEIEKTIKDMNKKLSLSKEEAKLQRSAIIKATKKPKTK